MLNDNEGNKVFRPSVESLMAKGVQVEVWKTRQIQDEDPQTNEMVTVYQRIDEKRWMNVQFSNTVLAQIERRWGTTEVWHKALEVSPFRTILDTFVILCGNKDEKWVSEILRTDAIEEYQFALQVAYLIAMGASPEDLGKVLDPILAIGKVKSEVTQVMARKVGELAAGGMENLEAIRGAITSDSGSSSTDPSQNSGNSISPSTSSSLTPTSNGSGGKPNETVKHKTDRGKRSNSSQPEKAPSKT